VYPVDASPQAYRSQDADARQSERFRKGIALFATFKLSHYLLACIPEQPCSKAITKEAGSLDAPTPSSPDVLRQGMR
jgi:hypothetical protein